MFPLQQVYRLLAAAAPLLAPRGAPLRLLELLLCLAVVVRVLHDLVIRRDQKHLQAYIYAGLASAQWKWLHRDFCTGDTRIPAIRLTRDGDNLGVPASG